MSLTNYFDNVEGLGVLGTADREGKVDLALYGKPQVLDEDTVAFVMGNRLSHDNIEANPHAAYLFLENGDVHNGLRMYLTKLREETDPDKIEALRRPSARDEDDFPSTKAFLVYFRADQVRRLIDAPVAEARWRQIPARPLSGGGSSGQTFAGDYQQNWDRFGAVPVLLLLQVRNAQQVTAALRLR